MTREIEAIARGTREEEVEGLSNILGMGMNVEMSKSLKTSQIDRLNSRSNEAFDIFWHLI